MIHASENTQAVSLEWRRFVGWLFFQEAKVCVGRCVYWLMDVLLIACRQSSPLDNDG